GAAETNPAAGRAELSIIREGERAGRKLRVARVAIGRRAEDERAGAGFIEAARAVDGAIDGEDGAGIRVDAIDERLRTRTEDDRLRCRAQGDGAARGDRRGIIQNATLEDEVVGVVAEMTVRPEGEGATPNFHAADKRIGGVS